MLFTQLNHINLNILSDKTDRLTVDDFYNVIFQKPPKQTDKSLSPFPRVVVSAIHPLALSACTLSIFSDMAEIAKVRSFSGFDWEVNYISLPQ